MIIRLNRIDAYYVGNVNVFDIESKDKLTNVLAEYPNCGTLVTLIFLIKGILYYFKLLFYMLMLFYTF